MNNGLIQFDDTKYKNCDTKIHCINKDGYHVFPTIANLKHNREPEIFHRNNPYTIQNIKKFLEINNPNIELLSDSYESASSNLHCRCRIDGNEWFPCWGSLKQGHGCPECSKKKQLDNRGSIKKEDYDEVIRLYLETNIPIINIAKQFGVKSKDPVYRVLRENNIDINHDRHSYRCHYIDKDISDKIYDMYCNQKITKRKIAKKLHISIYEVDQILKERNVKIRQHYANEFDETYFDIIDSNNKAYLLGFLYADGCVNKNNDVSIIIHEKDIEILEMFRSELNASNKISNVKNKDNYNLVRLSFSSKHMTESLIKIGCVHNKTYNLNFPNLEEKYIWHFIRGFMDGDGCMSLSKHINLKGEIRKYLIIGFVGTESMMNSLKNIFKIDNKIYLHRNVFHLQTSKENDVLRIGELIYKDAELFMKRKYDNYIEYLEYINLRNKGVILHEQTA